MPKTHPKVLITAGPTHEPIDSVRYIANRSSGRVGIEIARAALRAGWDVTLALGPTPLFSRAEQIPDSIGATDSDTQSLHRRFRLIGFGTTEDLRAILSEMSPTADVLIMAAAVADYRPLPSGDAGAKLRRDPRGLTLQLEATPDLLAECATRRESSRSARPGLIVAFALEPADGLLEAAQAKLARKGADLIVANPLETMDADSICATLLASEGVQAATDGEVNKADFGAWLIHELGKRL